MAFAGILCLRFAAVSSNAGLGVPPVEMKTLPETGSKRHSFPVLADVQALLDLLSLHVDHVNVVIVPA